MNDPLVDTTAALPPQPAPLVGRFVRLEPLLAAHADTLYPLVNGPERETLWRYMAQAPFDTPQAFHHHMEALETSIDPLFLTLVDPATGAPRGYASFMRIDVTNRVAEIGNIMFSPALQRTVAATEALYLMIAHAFEALRYRRFEWKCNALNTPSRRAALRLGFSFEGIFRQHMIVKGLNRDTAWFSMLDHEWPSRRAGFEAWLAPDNFDTEGRQRQSLADLRTKAARAD